MEKVAKVLADYVIRKGMVDEENRNIYEYGFTVTIEVGLFVLFCLLMTLYLHMYMQGILFFIIFAPLRSYAGGLHLEKYHSCFVLSCLTFSGVLLIVRYIQFPIWISFITLFILEIVVYALYPIENINRKVDREEDSTIRNFLIVQNEGKREVRREIAHCNLDMIIAVACIILNNNGALFLITDTFLVVVITMLMGKYKNSNRYLTSE